MYRNQNAKLVDIHFSLLGACVQERVVIYKPMQSISRVVDALRRSLHVERSCGFVCCLELQRFARRSESDVTLTGQFGISSGVCNAATKLAFV